MTTTKQNDATKCPLDYLTESIPLNPSPIIHTNDFAI